jgi:hypothetical protein
MRLISENSSAAHWLNELPACVDLEGCGTVFFADVAEVSFFEDTTLGHWVGNRRMTF